MYIKITLINILFISFSSLAMYDSKEDDYFKEIRIEFEDSAIELFSDSEYSEEEPEKNIDTNILNTNIKNIKLDKN